VQTVSWVGDGHGNCKARFHHLVGWLRRKSHKAFLREITGRWPLGDSSDVQGNGRSKTVAFKWLICETRQA
jgi:hypothetical protein